MFTFEYKETVLSAETVRNTCHDNVSSIHVSPKKSFLNIATQVQALIAIYASLIYTATYVMCLVRADTLYEGK
jgi:hypothetical protein